MESNISAYQEQVLFHYILSEQMYLQTSEPDFFSNQLLKDAFEIAKEHALKYKEAPSKDQLLQLIKIKGSEGKLSDDIITALYNTKQLLAEYDDQWLKDNVGAWIQMRKLETVFRRAIAYMKTTKANAENASDIVEKVRHMITTETAIDFTFNLGLDFFDATSHLQTRLARTSSGYEYIDLCLKGGYWKGSLIVFLSGPKAGKSMWLGNLALKSVLSGYNTAYVTLELQEEIINMRIGSNLFNIELDTYEKSIQDQDMLRNKIISLKQASFIPIGKLHVKGFPSSTMSANDLTAYLIKAQEMLNIKFDNVFIDYINLVKNWRNPNSENTYLKIKQISEDLRAAAQQNNWCFITATQTNRTGWDSSDLHITHIAESAGLLHTVDVLFGIVTNPEMKAGGEYFLKCLANRVAGYENTRKRYTIDWHYARIEEDKISPIQDMDFFINNLHSQNKLPRGSKIGTQSQITAIIGSNLDPDKIESHVNVTGQGLF